MDACTMDWRHGRQDAQQQSYHDTGRRKLGVTKAYVCMVLNGHRSPKGAEQKFNAALDALIKEKEEDNERLA